MFGMPLGECLTSFTHRQSRIIRRWIDEQWDKPSRSDYYAMQIAARVIDSNRNGGTATSPNSQLIKFEKPKQTLSPEEQRNQDRLAVSIWMSRVSKGKKKE